MLFRFGLASPRDRYFCIESCGSLPLVIVEDCYNILLRSSHYARGDVTVLGRFRSFYDSRFVSAGAAAFRAPPPIYEFPLLLLVPSSPPLGCPTR